MSKKLKMFLAILAFFAASLFTAPFFTENVGADSGWDSSYDSGGSWDSGSSSSDWGSSSSSSDWGSSSSSHGHGGSSSGAFGFIVMVFVVIFIFYIALGSATKSSSSRRTSVGAIYHDITEEELQKVFPDQCLQSVKNMACAKFVDVQNAWMEFNYDALRELCGNELYNSYIADLDVLKLKNGKNIMNDFRLVDIKVTGVGETEDGLGQVTVFLHTTFYDYVIDQGTGRVIRGNKNTLHSNAYLLTFTRDKVGAEQVTKCPNCGAEVKDNTTGVCEFCRATIVKKPKEFVLSRKTKVN